MTTVVEDLQVHGHGKKPEQDVTSVDAKIRWHQRLINSMDDGFCVIELIVDDADRIIDVRFQDMNPAFFRLTGIPAAEGQLASVVLPDLEPHWFDHYERVYESGEPLFFVEYSEQLGQWYEVSLNRIGKREERQLTCIFKDVTERKRQEDERERTTRRLHELATALSESDRRKTEFLATLAHELRNPLAPIRNGLELIAGQRTEPVEIDRTREMMVRQVDQMVRLVDDLLDVSRISQGTIFLHLERTLLADVINTAIESSRPLIEAEHHALDIELPASELPLVLDPVRITQVVANLLNNAARYTQPGGHLHLSATVSDKTVKISVSDDGEGIDKQGLTQVFEMFTQITHGASRQHGGLGIGLTLSRKLVEMHGGTLTAFSKGLGKGSRFEVRLPYLTELADDTTLQDSELTHGPRPGTQRVLVVDDNCDAADALAKLLHIRGFESLVAYDGRTAVATVLERTPDVVFIDIGLPDITGYQVVAEIDTHGTRQNLTLVALTGWGAREDLKRSEEAGFDHHLTKPVSARKVLDLLAQIADVRSRSKPE